MERRELIRTLFIVFIVGLIVSFIFSLDGYPQGKNKSQTCTCSCNCHNCEATR